MRFYDLPDVLIDYVFSFDDNYYYKKAFTNTLNEAMAIRSRYITNLYLSSFHHYYSIYVRHMMDKHMNVMPIAEYIFLSNQHNGSRVVLDKMEPSDIIKAKRNMGI